MTPDDHTEMAALKKLGNMSPAELRSVIRNNGTWKNQAQVAKLYPTRGDLIAEAFAMFRDGDLQYLARRQKEARP